MSVTVEVRGVPAGGTGQPQGGATGVGGSSGAVGGSGNGFLPADDRMIADVRREMQSRGVLLVPGSQGLSQIISQYRKQISDQAQAGIGRQFQERREALIQRTEQEEAGILEIENPVWRKNRLKQLSARVTEEEGKIDSEEAAAKSRVETELTDAIKRLTDAFEREAENNPDQPESYIGRLRQQQKSLIAERDAAGDEEGAIAASKRLAEVNEQLRRAMTGEDSKGGRDGKEGGWGVALSGMRGMEQFMSSANSGNLGGMISGIGGAGVGIASGLGGLSMSTVAGLMGVVGIAAALASFMQSSGERYDNISRLASYGTIPGNYNLRQAGERVAPTIRSSTFMGWGDSWYDIGGLGMNEQEFYEQAAKRIRARGMSDDWFNETYRQVGIERTYGLREGALMNAGAYDRYGTTGTQALVDLVNRLQNVSGSGVTNMDFTRVQEKLDIQQQIMGSYMNRVDRPSYDAANRAVLAMSSVRGITQDARIGNDYLTMQNALQNPMNDRMKALVYGVVEDIIPGTRGRMDKIDAALRSDKNEGQILQSVIQRITQMYGGMDTQMGYFAFRSIFPGIAPDRLANYIKDFSDPNSLASKTLVKGLKGFVNSNGEPLNIEDMTNNTAAWGTAFTSGMSSDLSDIANDVHAIWDWISGNSSSRGVENVGSNGNRSAQ